MKKVILFTLLYGCLFNICSAQVISRGTGLEYTPDSLRLKIPIADIPFCSNGTEMPNFYDLSDKMPPVGDQSIQGSCCAWATAYATRSYLLAQKDEFSFDGNNLQSVTFSPAFLYNSLNKGEDKGVCFYVALDFLRDYGCVTMGDMPYDPHDYLTKPSADLFSKAAKFKIESYKQLDKGANLNDMIKLQLYSGYPVIVGVVIDDGFQNQGWAHKSTNPFIWKNFDGSKQGYHAMVCVGYSDELQSFKIMNSWGTGWGQEGFVWIPYSFTNEAFREIHIAKDDKKFVPPPPPPPIKIDTLIVIKRDTIQIVRRDTIEKIQKDTVKIVNTDTVVIIKKDELNPLQLLYVKGVKSYLNDNYSDAIAFLKEFVNIENNNDSAFYYLAMSNYKLKDFSNSIENYNKVLNISADFTSAYKYRGSSYFNLEQFDNAINDLNIACSKNTTDAEAFFYRGLSFKRKNDFTDALSDFTTGINSNQSNPNLYFQRGLINLELKNYNDAIADFSKSISLNPNVSMFYMKRGFAKYKVNMFEDATKDYLEAIKINPENFDANKELGLSYYKDNKFSDAVSYLGKAAKIDNTDGFVFFVLGYAYYETLDYKNAVSSWEKAFTINPLYKEEVGGKYFEAKSK